MGKAKGDKKVLLFAAGPGMRVIRKVEMDQAARMEAAGAWLPVFDGMTARLEGYRVVGDAERKVDADVRSRQTAATITRGVMERNAMATRLTLGQIGRTARFLEKQDGRRPESSMLRDQAMVLVYAQVGAAKGDVLRAWPR